ncbi:autotransporter strand-loop-strand O-heptosyltransferase [Bradyrhizobium sp. HKCCYLS20291]|uniref:autotransporter strand-loop-strand O-heptosyltransferase n=1 Tax=Bradyrhizobium sp. HKCCYLS20291 TaxID=3420766 RepID=UPI003EBF7C54
MNVAHIPRTSHQTMVPTAESAQQGAETGASDRAGKPRLPPPAAVPTQDGPYGLRFDFNDGCRVMLPDNGRAWRVRMSDRETGNVLFDVDLRAGHVNSSKRYFVPFRLEVWSQDERLLCHDYDASERDVLIQFPVGTIGDIIGWISYAVKFKDRHGCRLTCAMGETLIPLFQGAYPDITFVTHEAVQAERFYATYSVALFFDDAELVYQPCDFRQVGLHRHAAYVLGVDPAEQPPRLAVADDSRPIAEPYVCISVQATTQCKHWNNPEGWDRTVAFLRARGYRVICIDQHPVRAYGSYRTQIPAGAEDQTGDRPLLERARWLRHAALFVGLSSGLSWLAWAAGIPVVLISGFSHPVNEFTTPYRVINYHACNGCWNDRSHRFDHKDFLWCPRLKGTPRQFECTRLITPEHVVATLLRIPGLRGGQPSDAQARPSTEDDARERPPGDAKPDRLLGTHPPRMRSGDEPLAISTLLAGDCGDVHHGGLAVGLTVGAGSMLDQAAAQIAAGDRAATSGDVATALEYYKQSAAMVRTLTEADPDHVGFQRKFSVTLNRIGAILFVQRDLERAQAAYAASLAVTQRLHAAQPNNSAFKQDLVWCHALLADVLAAQDRHQEAFDHRRANAALTTQMAALAPTDPTLQRALVTSYQNLADALVALGNYDGALAAYRVSLGLIQRALSVNAQDAAWNQLYTTLLQRIRTALQIQRQAAPPS